MILDIDPEVAQQLQAAQTTYHQNRVIGTGDYEALMQEMFDEFEQTEREQGFAFLSHPRPITPATRSEYIEPLRRIQGEAPLTGDALTALVSSFPDSELEAMSADPNRQRPAPSAPDRRPHAPVRHVLSRFLVCHAQACRCVTLEIKEAGGLTCRRRVIWSESHMRPCTDVHSVWANVHVVQYLV